MCLITTTADADAAADGFNIGVLTLSHSLYHTFIINLLTFYVYMICKKKYKYI